jgi:hypothetical protein
MSPGVKPGNPNLKVEDGHACGGEWFCSGETKSQQTAAVLLINRESVHRDGAEASGIAPLSAGAKPRHRCMIRVPN